MLSRCHMFVFSGPQGNEQRHASETMARAVIQWLITTLKTLRGVLRCRLFNCDIYDAGAESIAAGLAANKTLQFLE